MALSFAALNYSLSVLDDAKHRNKYCVRSLPPSSSSCSSLPSATSSRQLSSFPSGTKNSSEFKEKYSSLSPAGFALIQSNTVGIIGGVSVLSTLIFLEKLVLWSSRNGKDSVPFIVCSNPVLIREASNSSMSMNTTINYKGNGCVFPGLDQSQVADTLRSKRVYLEEGGAQCLVMPCHVSHVWYNKISQGCELPFLHVAKCVARELKEVKFKPLEIGSKVKIGLIATEATLMAGFYQEELQNQGFEVVVPDRATTEHIIQPAVECLKQKDIEGARNLLRIVIQVLLVKAVNIVIVASDELQSILPHDDPLAKKCIDPLDALARSVARWATSAEVAYRTPT